MEEAGHTIRVWDAYVRFFHWSLVASFAVAWFSGDDWKALHLWSGYAAAALVAARILWGVAGSHYARFSQFVKPPAAIVRYIGEILAGREARYIGHNPAGGAMIVALLGMLAILCFTGWLLTTDTYWGSEPLERVHEALSYATLGLIGFHVCGVAVACVRHRENLPLAMLTGTKRGPGPADVA